MEGTFLRSSNTTNEQGISFKGPQYLEILIKFYTVPLVFLVFQNPPPLKIPILSVRGCGTLYLTDICFRPTANH